jgi:hypothetical protein
MAPFGKPVVPDIAKMSWWSIGAVTRSGADPAMPSPYPDAVADIDVVRLDSICPKILSDSGKFGSVDDNCRFGVD